MRDEPSRVHLYVDQDRVHVFAVPTRPLSEDERMCTGTGRYKQVIYHARPVQVGNEWMCELCGELTGGGEA